MDETQDGPTPDRPPLPPPSGTPDAGPDTAPTADPTRPPADRAARFWWRAAFGFQVFIVCGIPTQLLVGLAVASAGFAPMQHGELSLEFVALVGLLETALVAFLIRHFLRAGGDSAEEVFVGPKSARREALLGLALVPVAFGVVLVAVLALRTWLPSLHTVEENPLDALMRTPLDGVVFLLVATVVGLREELQRAFVLHRFRQRLGGIYAGLLAYSAFFGALHAYQGSDVAVAIGLMGLAWGLIYIRRRSAVMAMANHAGFNATQVAQAMLARAMGVG